MHMHALHKHGDQPRLIQMVRCSTPKIGCLHAKCNNPCSPLVSLECTVYGVRRHRHVCTLSSVPAAIAIQAVAEHLELLVRPLPLPELGCTIVMVGSALVTGSPHRQGGNTYSRSCLAFRSLLVLKSISLISSLQNHGQLGAKEHACLSLPCHHACTPPHVHTTVARRSIQDAYRECRRRPDIVM